jgi:HlyD family secretion protein
MLMPRRPGGGSSAGGGAPDADGMRSIWVLRDGAPVEAKVRTGASDGSHTQIVEGGLSEGDPVITSMDSGQ